MKLLILALIPFSVFAWENPNCMDAHGSIVPKEMNKCESTPEYMYMDRETQRLTMQLDALSAQAQERIADGTGGAGIHSITNSPTTVRTDNGSASQSQATGGMSNSTSHSSSNSHAQNSNSNTNTNLTFR